MNKSQSQTRRVWEDVLDRYGVSLHSDTLNRHARIVHKPQTARPVGAPSLTTLNTSDVGPSGSRATGPTVSAPGASGPGASGKLADR